MCNGIFKKTNEMNQPSLQRNAAQWAECEMHGCYNKESKYSLSQLLEKTGQINILVYMTFVDYEKVFDSV